jgi:hypothetical protein
MNIQYHNTRGSRTRYYTLAAVIAAAIILAAFTTLAYVRAQGVAYLSGGAQVKRHEHMIHGCAGNPWQYRVLSAYLLEGLVRLCRLAGASRPYLLAFVTFRFLQDAAIFLAAVMYFKKLGLSLPHAIIGIMILAWGISYSHYHSDLQFSTFFDILFYLLAGSAIISNAAIWILPITVLGAFNRETSGLIPFMYLAATFAAGPARSRVKALRFAGLIIGLYILVFVGLRLAHGHQKLITPASNTPGLALLRYNLLRSITWWQWLATFSLVPFLALLGYRSWPVHLRVFFWVVAPAWYAVHLVAAVMAETRVLLVPQALVSIPGALIFAQQTARGELRDHVHNTG